MVNQVILDYLSKYGKKYRVEDLKRKIIASGYDEEEVEEALEELGLRVEKKEKEEGGEKKEIVIERPVEKEEELAERFAGRFERAEQKPTILTIQCKSPQSYQRWLKVGGICGVILVILFVLFAVFVSGAFGIDIYLLSPFVFASSLIILLVSVLFLYAFITLDKKYNGRLVKVACWGFIILAVLLMVFLILLMVFPEDIGGYLLGSLASSAVDLLSINFQEIIDSFFNLIIILAVILLVFVILNIIFGIGLIKLKVQHSKLAGILHIVGAVLLFAVVGMLILILAYIVDAILLIKESKK